MGFPCKEKSHIIALFANFCHQRMHQVLHSTLNLPLIVAGFVTVEQVYRSESYGKKIKQGKQVSN